METSNLSLKSQLSQFGLNPMDWALIPKTDNIIDIVNYDEPSLKLLGTTNKSDSGENSWSSIFYLDQ